MIFKLLNLKIAVKIMFIIIFIIITIIIITIIHWSVIIQICPHEPNFDINKVNNKYLQDMHNN